MTNLILLFSLCFIGMLFWRQRQQSEFIQQTIERQCKNLGLQVLSVSRGTYRLKDNDGHWGIYSEYHFEFSADGSDAYQGHVIAKGHRLKHFYVPPHRLPMHQEN
jgi:hypothetical protein